MKVRITIDGQEITVSADSTVQGAIRAAGLAASGICSPDRVGYPAAGACRLCLVEIENAGALKPACRTPVRDTMVVHTSSKRALQARKLVGELTLSEQTRSAASATRETPLRRQLDLLAVEESRFGFRRQSHTHTSSNGAIRFDPDACVRCGACSSACRDVQVNDVIALAGRGGDTRVTFDDDVPLSKSTCVSCGECVDVCPVDALAFATAALPETSEEPRRAVTICPYCSVGCHLTVHVAQDLVVRVEGGDGPANRGRLCVKGRFGLEAVGHRDRLRTPLIRRDAHKVVPPGLTSAEAITELFRPASWDEALTVAAAGLSGIKSSHGSGAIAVLGSAKASNEDAYVLQKLARSVLGTSHVDHCTRLCASVPPLAEAIGFSAVTVPVEQVAEADVVLMVGSNPEVNHPVAATFIKNALRSGTKLILIDPYRQPFARHATRHLALWPGTDVTLLSAMIQVVISERLYDEAFVRDRIDGFEDVAAAVSAITPEAASRLTGVGADDIREAARLFARADRAITFWGMGSSQHLHGADNIRCIVALTLICGHVGKPGAGLHPLRGQNNVQGSCDAGLIPTTLPGYRRLDDAGARDRLQALWGAPPPSSTGLTVCEIIDAAWTGSMRGLYVAGGNPAMANPDLRRTRESLSRLDFLVVQDILPSETAVFADVILPAAAIAERDGTYTSTDRWLQRADAALPLPGEARPDWWITVEIARRMGAVWSHRSIEEIFDEMAAVVPVLEGVTWNMLGQVRFVRVPLGAPNEGSLFDAAFPTRNGRAKLTPVQVRDPGETPDADYPLILVTGRVREHWHTGTMTRRSSTLNSLAPRAVLGVSSTDFDRLLLTEGALIQLETRRGRIRVHCSRDERLQPGVVSLPFSYIEAAANELTAVHLDPTTRVPEYKLSAARIVPLNEQS